jgi:protein-disulfide isomerase
VRIGRRRPPGAGTPVDSLHSVSDLRSAPVPEPGEGDHQIGDPQAPLVVFYGDYTCPRCALAYERLRDAPVRLVFRHFALAKRHPRTLPLACAAEAAALQGRFWEFHASLFEDPAHTDDPHLWARVTELGLDLEDFERDRRSDAVLARVRGQTRDGMRAGITQTPTLVAGGRMLPGAPSPQEIEALTR